MADLVFDRVSIVYRTEARGDVAAVKDVSLTLPSGGTLGIAGESGSGKSTLAMSVLRLLPGSARLDGTVRMGDRDVSDLSFGQLRAVRWADASIVFQGAMHSLNPVRTVGMQILEALELHAKDRWTTKEARKERLDDLLGQVDLPTDRADAYPHELSGGQKQRIMIAMALACEPEIVIADEPTTALDVIVQGQVLEVLRDLVTRRGISLLLISHDLSVLSTACERIAVMRDGELVEVGDAADICTAPTHEYTRQLAEAFPSIGDPSSRRRPATRGADPIADAPDLVGAEPVLEARGLSVTFRARGRSVQAVRNVDLVCRAGEILALVGQSGSGKTTLARTLLGLERPDDGSEILFRGTPLPRRARDLKEFRSEVQLVLQDPAAALNPKLSVYESVAEGLRVQRYSGDEERRVADSLEAAELFPAAEYIASLPQELSGGQRQRVVIAGALAVDPRMLIADEPVASLDASARGEILALLLRLRAERGLSALVITHDLGLAWNIADTVAVMHRGEIVERGTVEDVLLDPRHEYTKELIAAAPTIARRGAE